MKNIKGTDDVILTLKLKASEARILRDEIYCVMGDLDEPSADDMCWDFELNVCFAEWLRLRQNKAYKKQTIPLLENLYVALRQALRQSAEVPALHGPYTRRYLVEKQPLRELYQSYLKGKLSCFSQFYGPESMTGSARQMEKRFTKSTGILIRPCDDHLEFGVADSKQETGYRWVCTLKEVEEYLLGRWDHFKPTLLQIANGEFDA